MKVREEDEDWEEVRGGKECEVMVRGVIEWI